MKPLVIVLLFVLGTAEAFAQVFVNGNDINKNPQIRVIKLFDNGFGKIKVDIGESSHYHIQDEHLNEIKFVGFMAASNYLASRGWELVSVYVISNNEYYLLKKKE